MKENNFNSVDHDMDPIFLPLVANQKHIQMSVDTLARQQQQMQTRLDDGLKTMAAGINSVMQELQVIQKLHSHGKSLHYTVSQQSKQNVEENERHLSPSFGEDKNENGLTPRNMTTRAVARSIASVQNDGDFGLHVGNDVILVNNPPAHRPRAHPLRVQRSSSLPASATSPRDSVHNQILHSLYDKDRRASMLVMEEYKCLFAR